MMFISFLLVGISTTTVLGDRLPSFEWVNSKGRASALPLLKIRFPDGQADDFAILKPFNIIPAGRHEDPSTVDNCIYDGYLANEDDVHVTLTGGCVYSKSFEIQFRSSRLQGHMFKVVDGVVEELSSLLGRSAGPSGSPTLYDHFVTSDVIGSDVGARGGSTAGSRGLNPKGYYLKIKIRYDDNFKAQFGADSENVIRRVMAHAQSLYKLKSLTTTVIFDIKGVQYMPGVWETGSQGLNTCYELNDNPDPSEKFISTEYVYFTYGHSTGMAGIATGGICSPPQWSPKGAVCLNQWIRSDAETGNTVAHEMGHNFGMVHDFDDNSGSSEVPRFDSNGKSCLKIGGIMDYNSNATVWTSCSVEDFTKRVDEFGSDWCLEVVG